MSTRLTDHQWERILPVLKEHKRVYVGVDARCRRFLDAVLRVARTGAQWRELPPDRGKWNTVYKRFRAWTDAGVFSDLLNAMADCADLEWLCFDSTVVRAHMSAAGAPHRSGGQKDQCLGRSRGGFSTKIHIKVDAHGDPLKNVLTGGHRHDTIGYRQLREDLDQDSKAVLLDKGYDADWIRKDLAAIQVEVVMPPNRNRSCRIAYDKHLYKHRHVVECFINKIKWFRRVFTRFVAFVDFASVFVWLR